MNQENNNLQTETDSNTIIQNAIEQTIDNDTENSPITLSPEDPPVSVSGTYSGSTNEQATPAPAQLSENLPAEDLLVEDLSAKDPLTKNTLTENALAEDTLAKDTLAKDTLAGSDTSDSFVSSKSGEKKKGKKVKKQKISSDSSCQQVDQIHQWFFTFMCMNIPIIGWFYLFYLAFSKKYPYRRSFARAYLFYKLIFLVISAVILGILIYIGLDLLDQLLAYMEML